MVRTRARTPVEQRFWLKVNKTETCWLWTGGKTTFGYGQIGLGGKEGPKVMAHRLSWEMHNGPIPDGKQVLHQCDNPACVNPAHLFLGSQKDNVDDMFKKGRQQDYSNPPKGEKYGLSKLNTEDVLTIRSRYAEGGVTQKQLAQEYHVHRSHIGRIVRGTRWQHIADQS